ncbi:hypothetical protein CFBP6762_03626 [Xanthomonas arboricola pv. fragariae]|nr:hypothetical protein CFBP6762_03626 [Xanthomonas arboricola pv. fragariae]
MGTAGSNGPAVQRGSARRSRPRPPRAGSIPQAGLRAREWKPAPPMPRLPMRLHSGVLRHLTSPTVAGAAPALQFAKAIRAPDSRLNHRNSGSHLRGAHGSRIGPGHLRGLRQAAKRNASPRVWMANGRFLLPPGEGAPKGADEGTERSLMPWMKAACRDAGMSACLPPSVISHMRVGFAPVPSPQPPLRAPARACGAGAPRHARPWRASCASYPPDGREASSRTSLACSRFPDHGSDVPRRQRGRGLAESGTRMCRDGESDRMSAEPKSRSPAALTP